MTKTTLPTPDYRQTLFLPKTDFPMRARLPDTEPKWLALWEKEGIYQKLRSQAKGRKPFLLHDGPPYANGHIHAGTALNKILKDMIIRSKQMAGMDAAYLPGWDCHGLPIEWQIEEEWRREKTGSTEKTANAQDFRAACRAYAAKWVDIQRTEFKRLGVMGDWEQPYLTMEYKSEAAIVREFLSIAMSGIVVRREKPVMWSSVEQTALAEAELIYADRKTPAVWARFRLANHTATSILIWTTTPWTLPANQAVAYGEEIEYALFEIKEVKSENTLGFTPYAQPGEKVIIARKLAETVMQAAHVSEYALLKTINPATISALRHPFSNLPEGQALFGADIPLLPGNHVGEDTGTGFVHTAPAHGEEDYRFWQKHKGNTAILSMLDPAGRYAHPDLPAVLSGLEVIRTQGKKRGQDGDANKTVTELLAQENTLFSRSMTTVRDAHSWRSRAPVIRRATPQWFISMDSKKTATAESLREMALKAIDSTQFIPSHGRNRLRSMVADRPDWLVSRQRQWGTPIPLFIHRETGEILRDQSVNARIVQAVEKNGSDAWFTLPDKTFLGRKYTAEDYHKITDILDVWFDSGSTHAFAMQENWPADLYLEGSDQHRGWFQSSLLQACATRGKAPFRAILTHGFVVDEKGRKMSKSLGNTVSPMEIAKRQGAEILRVWAAACDYSDDPGIGTEILAVHTESYRRLRNTLRYLLGALNNYPVQSRITMPETENLPEIERYVLHRLAETEQMLRRSQHDYDLQRGFHGLINFCVNDLSSFYFDIRKDALYCDPLSEPRRQACLSVMATLFNCLTAWLAPVLVFTCEEAWRQRHPQQSVHERLFPSLPENWLNPKLARRWKRILQVRKVVTGALERERAEKHIGTSLEAAPIVYLSDPEDKAAFNNTSPEDVFITSAATLHTGPPPENAFSLPGINSIAVLPSRAKGIRCKRSWKYFDPATATPEHPHITPRDARAVQEWERLHAK